MKTIEKSWNEFWAYYWRVTQRKNIPAIAEYDHKVTSLVEARCNLSPPKRILDLGCGSGEHARLWAEKGYSVVGIDIAESLIQYARVQVESTHYRATFLPGDMRDISYKNEFDACTLLSGTFGFFPDEESQLLLKKINDALTAGGYIFIMYISAHRTDMNKTTWNEIENGYQLVKNWFEPETSTFHSNVRLILNSGEIIIPKKETGYHANEITRCFTPPEIGKMLTEAGFINIVHLGRKHFENPNATLEPWEIRETVVAQKKPDK